MNTSAVAAQPACYHCGLPVPADGPQRDIDGEMQPFCCPACLAVADTILGSGLGNYYRYREQQGGARAGNGIDFSAFDRAEFQRRWLRPLPDGEVETELLVGGMHCAACVWLLEHQLGRQPGVSAVRVNLSEQRASVRWRLAELPLSALCRTIAAVGYQPQPYSADAAEQLRKGEQRALLRRLGIAAIGSMQVGMAAFGLYYVHEIESQHRELLRWISLLLTLPIVLYSAQPFFSGAWRGLRQRRAGMDLPVAVAIILGTLASIWATVRGSGEVYYDSVTMFVFLLLGGRYLEMRARHYSGRLGGDLLGLLPIVTTRLRPDGGREQVGIDELRPDDQVLVAAGATLPADGTLLESHASVSEAALTGEFLPVEKRGGDALLAGSVNGPQALLLRVTATAAQSRLAAIQSLALGSDKPRLAQLADRYASHFTLAVLLIAAATWAAWHLIEPAQAFWIALSVLVVSCPCALGLATPAAITSATQALRRRGLLVTRADCWEKLPAITDVVFDKTGTLTRGEIGIIAVRPLGGRSEQVCRAIAGALEAGSSHPIARAFADSGNSAVSQRRQVAGSGVEGVIAGRRYRLGQPAFALAPGDGAAPLSAPSAGHWVLLADERGPVCWFGLDDRLRSDAATTVMALQRRGLTVHLLSGDPSEAAPRLAAQLGIDAVEHGASPERKLDYLRALQQRGRRVLMVGDGINDIPVLAGADVSVAMSDASQLAKTSADCLFLTPRLDRLLDLLSGARATRRIIRENLAWALGYNLVALPLAAIGLVPPWLAALGMSLSSLLVIGNALRLMRLARQPAA